MLGLASLTPLTGLLKAAHNEMIDIEELSDEHLEKIAAYYRQKKEQYPDDTVTAIASDVAEQAHDTAHRVAGGTTREVAPHTARGVAGDTAEACFERRS